MFLEDQKGQGQNTKLAEHENVIHKVPPINGGYLSALRMRC